MSSIPRFHVEASLEVGEIALPQSVARQAVTVLRLRPGDPLVLFDGTGPEWLAELSAVSKTGAQARLIERRPSPPPPPRRVTLCPALLKGEKMELVIQKGTELGAHAFRPLVTQRTVARDQTGRLDRWRRIAIEAIEQCGGTTIPTIETPAPLATVLHAGEHAILCWEDERRTMLRDRLRDATGSDIMLLIGPEGGFAPEEVQAALEAGAVTASLGARTLRAETAAIAAAVIALLAP